MNTIDYFKLQAKNLHKDFKTKKPFFDEAIKDYLYEYSPKYFDIDAIVLDFNLDEDSFTLMNAQHVIAQLVGFEKWTELLQASAPELELAKLLFDNQHKTDLRNWNDYIAYAEEMNQTNFDSETKLEIFKQTVLGEGIFEDYFSSYLLKQREFEY